MDEAAVLNVFRKPHMTLLISHIPKTAGSSLKSLVSGSTPGTVLAYGNELRLANPNLEFAINFRSRPPPPVVIGHFSFGAHRILGLKPKYATVLRDPIDRVVSLYRYQKSLPDSVFLPYFLEGLSLVDFVCRELTEMTNNHACRVIAGIPPEAGLVINEKWLLDLAWHNIQRHYVLIGTLEKIDSFVASLGQMLNWSSAEFPRLNVTEGAAHQVSPEEKACIVEMNALDIELYRRISSA